MESPTDQPAGWAKFGDGSWETASFGVESGAFAIRRSYGGATWLPLAQISAIDETAPEDGGWSQVELQMADGSAVGLKLLSTQLTELLVSVARAHQSASAPVAVPAGSATVIGTSGSRRTLGIVAVAVIGLLAAVVTVGFVANRFINGRTYEVRGLYTLFDSDGVDGPIENCEGEGGYNDFSPGGEVKVSDADGKIIGSGALESAVDREDLIDRVMHTDSSAVSEDRVRELLDDVEYYMCPLVFTVEVPKSERYEIESGSGRRGTFSYSFEEMSDNEWYISHSLGT